MNFKGDTLISNTGRRLISNPTRMASSSMDSMEIKPIPGQLELSTKDQQNLKGSIPIYKEGQTADKNSVQILDPVRTMHASSPLMSMHRPHLSACIVPTYQNTSSRYKRKGLFN